jgi:hypothetical protein
MMERTEVQAIIRRSRAKSSKEGASRSKVYLDINSNIKTPYIACIRGPILLSAPHSTRI